MRTVLATLILTSAFLMPGPAARALAGDRLTSILRAVPNDVDIAVVVQDAEGLRQGVFGAAMQGVISLVLGGGDFDRAWGDFAAALRMDEAAAFDFTLGRRFGVVGRMEEQGGWSWALLTEMPAADMAVLQRGLGGAPRRLLKGMRVFEVEGGRFDLLIDKQEGLATVLIAPSARPHLFDEIAPRLGGRPLADSLSRADAIGAMRRTKGGHLLVYWRDMLQKHGWVGVRGEVMENRFEAQFVATSDVALPDLPAWSIDRFDALTDERSLVVAMERRVAVGDELPVLGGPFREMPWLVFAQEAGDEFGPMQGVVIQRADGGVEITGLLQSQAGAETPLIGDALAQDLVRMLSEALGVGAAQAGFGGRWPDAERSVTITGPGGSSFPFIAGDGFDMHWAFAMEAPAGLGGEEDWLAISTDGEALHRAGEALRTPFKGGVRPWVSVGLARPAALIRTLKESGSFLPPVIDVLSVFERVEYRAVQTDAKRVEGRMSIEVDPRRLPDAP